MRSEATTLEKLRRGMQTWPIPKGQKIHYEFLPLLSWSAVPLFAELLDDTGPFVLEHEPKGNVPPDWTIRSGTKTTAIEVVQFVTPPMGAVIRHAQAPVDVTHLLEDRWPDGNFVGDLKAGKLCGEDLENDGADAEAVEDAYFTIALRELRKKYRDLPRYRASYRSCILLIWDTLFSAGTTLVDRPTVLRGWLENAPANGFDAVVMADGNGGAAANVSRLR